MVGPDLSEEKLVLEQDISFYEFDSKDGLGATQCRGCRCRGSSGSSHGRGGDSEAVHSKQEELSIGHARRRGRLASTHSSAGSDRLSGQQRRVTDLERETWNVELFNRAGRRPRRYPLTWSSACPRHRRSRRTVCRSPNKWPESRTLRPAASSPRGSHRCLCRRRETFHPGLPR